MQITLTAQSHIEVLILHALIVIKGSAKPFRFVRKLLSLILRESLSRILVN